MPEDKCNDLSTKEKISLITKNRLSINASTHSAGYREAAWEDSSYQIDGKDVNKKKVEKFLGPV